MEPLKRTRSRRRRRELPLEPPLMRRGRKDMMQEPLVTPDEKRGLILAHAAMRSASDPQQIVSVWAGAIAAFAVILVAWWWLAKPAYTELFARPSDPDVLEAKRMAAEFGAHTSQELETASKRLRDLESQVTRNQNTLDVMAKIMQESATSTIFSSDSPSSTRT